MFDENKETEFNPFDTDVPEFQAESASQALPAKISEVKSAETPDAAEPSITEKTEAEEEKYETKDGRQKANSEVSAKPAVNENPFETAIARAEEKQASDAKAGLIEKLPVFSYTNAAEEIADPSKTFDQLRNEKAEDFPELDDGTSVTWKMEYGKITKPVPTPKKTTIAEMKTKIEQSKEFLESLKRLRER